MSTDVAPGIEPASPRSRMLHFLIRLSSKAGPNAMSDRLIRRCASAYAHFHSIIQ